MQSSPQGAQMPVEFFDSNSASSQEQDFPPSLHILDPNHLTEEYNRIISLQANCRILQRSIFDKSTESIFKHPIGFALESQQAEDEFHDFLVPKFRDPPLDPMEDESQEKYADVWTPNALPFDHCKMKLLKEYVLSNRKGVSVQDKRLFVELRDEVQELARFVTEQFRHKDGNDHRCKLCGVQFPSGRQLGGHISRTHPSKAQSYVIKKDSSKVKIIQRKRRQHFKEKMKSMS